MIVFGNVNVRVNVREGQGGKCTIKLTVLKS